MKYQTTARTAKDNLRLIINIRMLAILLYKIIVLPSDVTHGYEFEV